MRLRLLFPRGVQKRYKWDREVTTREYGGKQIPPSVDSNLTYKKLCQSLLLKMRRVGVGVVDDEEPTARARTSGAMVVLIVCWKSELTERDCAVDDRGYKRVSELDG